MTGTTGTAKLGCKRLVPMLGNVAEDHTIAPAPCSQAERPLNDVVGLRLV